MKTKLSKIPKKTIILGFETSFFENEIYFVPKIQTFQTSFYQMAFYCEHCKKLHYHGLGDGHRHAHCEDIKPLFLRGYILKLKEEKDEV